MDLIDEHYSQTHVKWSKGQKDVRAPQLDTDKNILHLVLAKRKFLKFTFDDMQNWNKRFSYGNRIMMIYDGDRVMKIYDAP